MRTRHVLSVLALWTFVVGACAAFGSTEGASRAPQPQAGAGPVPGRVQPAPWVPSEPPIDQRMRQLDRHARFGMILYKGRIGDAERAAAETRLDAVALMLGRGTR
jgi:hypothetical protein